MIKNLPAKQEMRVRALGGEDPPKEEMATHSSILAWEILWTEEPGGLWSKELQRVRHNSETKQQGELGRCIEGDILGQFSPLPMPSKREGWRKRGFSITAGTPPTSVLMDY